VPRYDQGACIAYIIDKLKINGFVVRYIHPNMLFISWMHFVPSYVRTELKKKTGIVVDEFGKKIDENGEERDGSMKSITNVPTDPNDYILNSKNLDQNNKIKLKKEYTPINSYKPSGSLIYDDALLNKIEDKFL
jgi:hypothetical protein